MLLKKDMKKTLVRKFFVWVLFKENNNYKLFLYTFEIKIFKDITNSYRSLPE